jgi:transcriptional regulator with XRE-family HTH domain
MVFDDENKSYLGVIRCARKKKGFNQDEVAKEIGVSRSAYSAKENGDSPFHFSEVRHLKSILNITSENLDYGFIDSLKNQSIAHNKTIGKFHIPERYAYSQGSSIRVLRPYIEQFATNFGVKRLKNWLQYLSLDSDIFYDCDISLNMNFTLDILKFIKNNDGNNCFAKSLDGLAANMCKPFYRGNTTVLVNESGSPVEHYISWIESLKYFDVNFEYSVAEQGKNYVDLRCKPNDHVDQFGLKQDKLLGNAIEMVHKSVALRYARLVTKDYGPKTCIRTQKSIFKGHKECIHKIYLSDPIYVA